MTQGGDDEQRLRDGRGRRLGIIVVCVALLFGTERVLQLIGDRRVSNEVARIRQVASSARIAPSSVLINALNGGPDSIAVALGTDVLTEATQTSDASVCVTLEVQRLMSKRSLYFVIAATEQMQEAASCQ